MKTIQIQNEQRRKPGRPQFSTVERLPIGRIEHEEILMHIAQCVVKESIATKLVEMCTILHHTGLRASELRLITKGDIMSAIVDGSRQGKFSLSNDTKTNTTRLIRLSKKGVAEFKELFDVGWKDEELVARLFLNKKGKVLGANGIVKLLNNNIKKALGKLYSSHSYRAGYCTDLLNKGQVPANVVQKLVGHKNLQTTLRYNFASEEDLTDALERVR